MRAQGVPGTGHRESTRRDAFLNPYIPLVRNTFGVIPIALRNTLQK